MKTSKWTSADLEMLPDDSNRYEIIGGELYVSKQPSNYHQLVGDRIWELLQVWSRQTHAGTAITTPGLIFGEDNDVIPDVIWMSKERGAKAAHPDGKYHAAPELVVEILSPGPSNERRDREAKLQLYAHQGVLEYWIVSWIERRLDIYRRDGATLTFHSTLTKDGLIQSPYLPGFSCQFSQFFDDIR